MTRAAASTAEAADALEAWLTQASQARATVPRTDHPDPPPSTHSDQPDQDLATHDSPVASWHPSTVGSSAAPLRLAHTDWLHHLLTISGTASDVAAWRTQAAGSGMIPWHLDLDRMEEGWFHLLAAPPAPQERTLSIAGARILAAQLREATSRRHDLAVAQAAHVKSCPLDLHALLPVPGELLRRGPDDPVSLSWLWEHWGTTQALRHVILQPGPATPDRPDEMSDSHATLRLSFWSADWTPWRAFDALRGRYPGLLFDVRPTYDAA